MKQFSPVAAFLVALVALLFAGCGGGGGGGGSSAGIAFFATDDLHNGYDAVWVGIEKIELLNANGTLTAFDDPAGRLMNVRGLNTLGTNNFAFMGDDRVPAGDYTAVRVTLSKNVVLFETGQSSGLLREFAGLDGSGKKVLTATFGSPKPFSGAASQVIDFKLQNWSDDGTKVQGAEIVDGSNSGLDDPNRHEEDDFTGTVSGLQGAAPDFQFTLNPGFGVTINVLANAGTAIFNNDGSPNPMLANGKKVEVRGKYSPSDKALIATYVKIKGNPSGEDPHEVKGPTSEVDSKTGTFRVQVREAEGFLPPTTHVTVSTTPAGTRYFSHRGMSLTQVEFFAFITDNPGAVVEAEGMLRSDAGEPILDAVKVKIEDEDEFGEAEAKGNVTSIESGAGTFNISLIEWEGFSGAPNQSVQVVTGGQTAFRNDNGETIASQEFFALLSLGRKVEVKGSFASGVLTAILVKLEDLDDDAEARGMAGNVNPGSFTFDVTLTQWEGFDGHVGMVVHVTMAESTTFRGFDGEPMTRAQFFAALSDGTPVEAEGSFDPGTSTLSATKAKLED